MKVTIAFTGHLFFLKNFHSFVFFSSSADLIPHSYKTQNCREHSGANIFFFIYFCQKIIRFVSGWLDFIISGEALRYYLHSWHSETLPVCTFSVFSHQNCPNWGGGCLQNKTLAQGYVNLWLAQGRHIHFRTAFLPLNYCLYFCPMK